MKKIVIYLQTFLLIIILPGCDGPKKSNTQNAPAKVDEPIDASPTSTTDITTEKANDTITRKARSLDEMEKGSVTVDNMVTSLTQKLGLKPAQTTSVKDVLTKNFLSTGRNLEKEYSFGEIKNFRREILQNSTDEIMGFLDTNQQEQFKKLLNR